MDREELIERLPEGTQVFRGTTVPVTELFDCLRAGGTINTFVSDFPAVTREQTKDALRLAYELTMKDLLGEAP